MSQKYPAHPDRDEVLEDLVRPFFLCEEFPAENGRNIAARKRACLRRSIIEFCSSQLVVVANLL